MLKRVTALGCCVLMSISCNAFTIPIQAAESALGNPSIISPFYVYVNYSETSLSINNGVATIKGYVEKTPSGKAISLSCTLQKKVNGSWTNITSWSNSSSSATTVRINETYSVSSGTYRVKTVYSVDSESGTMYSETVAY